MERLLSYSEIETALTCWQRWDFAYGGHTLGATLKPKDIAPILTEGRAWGAAVATWHALSARSLFGGWEAHRALRAALEADALALAEHGFPVPVETYVTTQTKLATMLDHYMATTQPLANLTRLEGEILVPLIARSGSGRASARYRYLAKVDGFTEGESGRWLVEFKLRGALTPPPILQLQRQPRWYAWALAREQGFAPTGVIIDERLNQEPKAPRLVKGRRPDEGRVPSHAKDQLCTADAYVDVCAEHAVAPHEETIAALEARAWQQRFPILFRPDELDDAGQELIAASKLIRDLDGGGLSPVRNASRAHCNGCRYREICAEPHDDLLVDALFERTVPKRLRSAAPDGPDPTQPTSEAREALRTNERPLTWTTT